MIILSLNFVPFGSSNISIKDTDKYQIKTKDLLKISTKDFLKIAIDIIDYYPKIDQIHIGSVGYDVLITDHISSYLKGKIPIIQYVSMQLP